MIHSKYPKIGQYRNLVKQIEQEFGYVFKNDEEGWVRDPSIRMPTIRFNISTKLHGTNAGVRIDPDNNQVALSRRNVVTVENDNQGFATWHYSKQKIFNEFRYLIADQFPEIDDNDIVIFGEWCGKGIAKGVGINSFDKFLYIFGVKVIDESGDYWLKDYDLIYDIEHRIFDKRMFETKQIDIDFNDPVNIQNELVDICHNIENACPVAKQIALWDNVELDNTIGEGFVLEHIDDTGKMFQAKIKGEKHSSSRVKKLASVDTEKLNSIKEFVDYAVTNNRLEQMFAEVCNNDPDRKLLGQFIKAVSTDVIKEESDTLSNSGLTMKDVGSSLSKKARTWFFEQEKL